MIESYSGLATWHDGDFDVQDRRAFRLALDELPEGELLFTIQPTTKAAFRSLQANRFMWKVFEIIGEDVSLSKDDVHDLMCQKFLTHTIDMVDKTTGVVESLTVTRGTSRLTVAEHTKFLDEVLLWASEWLGLVMPERDYA